jgi:hypothetical protein
MYDLSFNIDGVAIGLVGAAITSLYQVVSQVFLLILIRVIDKFEVREAHFY